MKGTLDPRLLSAAELVGEGAVVADIGTDHAYLPLYLLETGKARFAVASDLRKGPLERARKNAEAAGMTDKMRFVLSDGLSGLEPEREGVTDICICGMGGELIARILDASPYTRKKGVRLILGPMSSPEELRAYLGTAGFAILEEKLSESGGKRYATLLAAYDGCPRMYSRAELLLGRANIDGNSPLFIPFAEDWLLRIRTRIAGRRLGGVPTEEDEALRDEITRLIRQSKERRKL